MFVCVITQDLRAQPIELSVEMLRNEPGLISELQRTKLYEIIFACEKKMVELFSRGNQFVTDDLEHDFIMVLRVKEHLAKSLGKPTTNNNLGLFIWDLDQARRAAAVLACERALRAVVTALLRAWLRRPSPRWARSSSARATSSSASMPAASRRAARRRSRRR